MVYSGYSDVELPGIVEELYRFAKGMMLHSSNDMQKKTAALFLLYGLHQNQKAQLVLMCDQFSKQSYDLVCLF